MQSVGVSFETVYNSEGQSETFYATTQRRNFQMTFDSDASRPGSFHRLDSIGFSQIQNGIKMLNGITYEMDLNVDKSMK